MRRLPDILLLSCGPVDIGTMYGRDIFTISAEDCYGVITKEIEALWQGHELVNKGSKEPKGRIFVSKAVILLCECRKCRDADHLQNFIMTNF